MFGQKNIIFAKNVIGEKLPGMILTNVEPEFSLNSEK